MPALRAKTFIVAEGEYAIPAETMERCCAFTMEKWYVMSIGLGLTSARSKEEFYGFRASDIVEVHVWMMGFGRGLFFRLRDGRVFDAAARQHDPDPALYDQTVH
jgi:hypothetical protein